MHSKESDNNDDRAQASLADSWDNRNPNPTSSSEKEISTDGGQKSQGVAIAQSPQSVVNSNGIVLPFSRNQLTPIETWGGEPHHTQTIDDLFPTPSPDETETHDSNTTPSNSSSRPRDPEHETTSEQRTRLKPISTHAKRAAEHTTSEDYANATSKTVSDDDDADFHVTPTGREIVTQECPECENEVVVKGSDQYCSECGLVIADEQIDPGPEWRAFDHQQQSSRSRVGGPVKNNIHDKGLSTVIGNDKTDAHGKPLSPKMKKKMARLRKWDSRFKVKNTKERNLRQAFGEIQRISSEMDLPDYVEETACTVYRRALDEELLPGRSIEAMSSASVYIAVRQAGIPKTLDTLIDYCRVSEARVTGAYSYLGRELGIEIEPPKVLEYLNRVSSELEVSKQTERKAEELLQNSVDKKLHSGKAPSGMAAAAVYAATMITRCDRVTQEEACKAGDVCELTIRTRHRELLDAYGLNHENVSPPSQAEVADAREALQNGDYDAGDMTSGSPSVTAD